jgi:hypothetical protein
VEKIRVAWDMTPCNPLQQKKAVHLSEKYINIYKSTRCHIQGGGNFHIHRRDGLKFCKNVETEHKKSCYKITSWFISEDQ